MTPAIEADLVAMLSRDHARMRKAGTSLAEAALRVIRDGDGCHRLALAVAEWSTAVANEGDRPIAPCDRRLPGLEHAEGIADHWHQRFLVLRDELPNPPSTVARGALSNKALSAKQVLDDIRDERSRLASPDPHRNARERGE